METWRSFFDWLLTRGRKGGRREAAGASPPYPPDPPDRLPVETLAYVGDAVYELFVRTDLVRHGLYRGENLHREAVKRVRAPAQAQKLRELEGILSEQEKNLVRRGRNAKTGRVPKGARVLEYRYSTALEVLVGYLFLQGEWGRLEEILSFLAEETQDYPPGLE